MGLEGEVGMVRGEVSLAESSKPDKRASSVTLKGLISEKIEALKLHSDTSMPHGHVYTDTLGVYTFVGASVSTTDILSSSEEGWSLSISKSSFDTLSFSS